MCVECIRDAREIKKIGGIDTCGTAMGSQILTRVTSEMASLAQNQKAESGKEVPEKAVFSLDPNDALNRWWTAAASADSHQCVLDRQHDMLRKLMFADEQTIVVVGHSLFFRKLFETFIPATAASAKATDKSKNRRDDAALKEFGDFKMENAAVVQCAMDFTGGLESCITDAKLLFGTKLMNKGHVDNEGAADEELELDATRVEARKKEAKTKAAETTAAAATNAAPEPKESIAAAAANAAPGPREAELEAAAPAGADSSV